MIVFFFYMCTRPYAWADLIAQVLILAPDAQKLLPPKDAEEDFEINMCKLHCAATKGTLQKFFGHNIKRKKKRARLSRAHHYIFFSQQTKKSGHAVARSAHTLSNSHATAWPLFSFNLQICFAQVLLL